MGKYVIEPALVLHAEEIAMIEAETFSRPWSRESVEASIADENTEFLVCLNGRHVVGYLSAQMICPECYIGNLAVRDTYRRQGIGFELLQTMIRKAEKYGCEFVSLEVRVSNTAAIRLYERTGFRIQGIRPDYYSAPAENAAIYTLFFRERETK